MVAKRDTVSYWRWIIAQEKIQRQMQGLSLVLQKARIDYNAVFPVTVRDPVQKEYIRQLEIEQSKLLVASAELAGWASTQRVLPSTLWDLIVVRLYEWSVYNR